MNARDKLIAYLRNNYERITLGDAEMLSDFILEDRKRIVKESVKYIRRHWVFTRNIKINQTLTNAGCGG